MTKTIWNEGHLLLEALLSVFFLSIISVSLLPAIGFMLQRSQRSQLDTDASLLVQEGVEATYNIFLDTANFDAIQSNNPGRSYELQLSSAPEHWELVNDTGPRGQEITGTPFTREIIISNVYRKDDGSGEKVDDPGDGKVDPGSKEVSVVVSWTDSNGNPQSVDAELLVANLSGN